MKQLFAVFCALTLTPMFSAQAWIGGPFSNNTFFGENGDDGVYEAVATAPNGIGLFRIVVGNEFGGEQDFFTSQATVSTFDDNGNLQSIVVSSGINSGNVFIGGFGGSSNVWFFQGVQYAGLTTGTVNSSLGQVIAVGSAADSAGTSALSSSFEAILRKTGALLPATAFAGAGEGGTQGAVGVTNFSFTVIGSKVSNNILYGF